MKITTRIYCAREVPKAYQSDQDDLLLFQKSLSISRNVSKILDQLLKGYDKRLRPNYAGTPVTVGITSKFN